MVVIVVVLLLTHNPLVHEMTLYRFNTKPTVMVEHYFLVVDHTSHAMVQVDTPCTLPLYHRAHCYGTTNLPGC